MILKLKLNTLGPGDKLLIACTTHYSFNFCVSYTLPVKSSNFGINLFFQILWKSIQELYPGVVSFFKKELLTFRLVFTHEKVKTPQNNFSCQNSCRKSQDKTTGVKNHIPIFLYIVKKITVSHYSKKQVAFMQNIIHYFLQYRFQYTSLFNSSICV